MYDLPLIAIVGQTASGKTAAAIEIAERFNGEIICADSRTIYKGMDIGTAKPTMAEQGRVPHHIIDVVYPDQRFSAAMFKEMAVAAIDDIRARGRLPLLVGGTGLYVDAVLFDFQFMPPVAEAERERLNALSIDELQGEILAHGYPMPVNHQNKRHLTRMIETRGSMGTRAPLRDDAQVFGIMVERVVLEQRIHDRIEAMVAAGFIDEARTLAMEYGSDAPGMLAPGYKAFRGYTEGTSSLSEAKNEFAHNDLQLAKRQRTWFKRNDSIQWQDDPRDIVASVTTFLNKSA